MNKKIFPIFLLLTLVQGCAIMWGVWERHWDLGVCRESAAGIYGCSVKVPKCSAGVRLSIIIHRKNTQIPASASMRIQIQNQESHTIEIQGRNPAVYLKAGESFEFNISPNYEINRGFIRSFDTHSGAIRIAINILSGRPEGATISIVGEASDGP